MANRNEILSAVAFIGCFALAALLAVASRQSGALESALRFFDFVLLAALGLLLGVVALARRRSQRLVDIARQRAVLKRSAFQFALAVASTALGLFTLFILIERFYRANLEGHIVLSWLYLASGLLMFGFALAIALPRIRRIGGDLARALLEDLEGRNDLGEA